MKKFLLLVLLCAIAPIAFAEKTDSVAISDLRYVVDKIESVSTQIAEDLGVSPDMVRQTMEKQVPVQIRQNYIIIWVLPAIFILFVALVFLFALLDAKTKGDYETPVIISSIVGVIVLIVACIIIPCCLTEIYQLNHNPDYWILEQLLDAVKTSYS